MNKSLNPQVFECDECECGNELIANIPYSDNDWKGFKSKQCKTCGDQLFSQVPKSEKAENLLRGLGEEYEVFKPTNF